MTCVIRTMDPALTEAAELLASQGKRREAIALVEQALRERRDTDTTLLLITLLLCSNSRADQNLGFAYLRRLQWTAGARASGSRSSLLFLFAILTIRAVNPW